jgi:hypothetical protein
MEIYWSVAEAIVIYHWRLLNVEFDLEENSSKYYFYKCLQLNRIEKGNKSKANL